MRHLLSELPYWYQGLQDRFVGETMWQRRQAKDRDLMWIHGDERSPLYEEH